LDEALDRGIGNGLGCSDAGALPMHASLEKNPRLTPLRIGRSDASGNSGNGGLEVAVKDEKQTNTRCGCCGGVPSRSVRSNDVHSAYEATREY
jgi:hypothetical protein